MDREFLERIDGHMARGNELMAEVREEMQLNRISYEHQLDLTRTVILRSEERHQRLQQRSNEVMERNRKAFEGNRKALEGNRMAFEGDASLTTALIDAINDLRTELGAEVRAQTEAIFKLIDRIDRLNGGASPA
jgi:hypothetical protein